MYFVEAVIAAAVLGITTTGALNLAQKLRSNKASKFPDR